MNLNSLFPVVLSLLLTIAALVQAAPEKGSRRDLPRQGATAFDREDYLKNHPELKEHLDKLKVMSPEERREWLKAHPEIAEKIEKFKEGGKEGGPESRADFLKDHPELKEHIEKLKAMSPEERQAWLKAHPEIAEKIEKAKGLSLIHI